jgi:thioester reductase-like protein
LLQKTPGRIYCLIRAGSQPEAERRLQKTLPTRSIDSAASRRIIAVPGNLARERFGMLPSVFNDLARDVQAIYHCAAEVNFLATYEQLAPTNVGGVREIIRLAAAGGAVLHHVSSVAVFPYGSTRIFRENEDLSQIKALTGGYAQSKWVAERMVQKAVALGLRAVIYRPAQILGNSNGAPRDLFEHVSRVCDMLRAVPDVAAKMDMVTSEYAAAAICALSLQPTSGGKVFHLVHPEPVSLRHFVGLLPSPIPLVPVESWLGRLNREASRRDDVSLHFISLLSQGMDRAELTPPSFDCSRTMATLKGTGIVCPALDRNFIRSRLVFRNGSRTQRNATAATGPAPA